MLSISVATVDYYLALAKEDYYLNGGEPPGKFYGKGAEKLKLPEKVEANAISNLFAGMSPDGTRSLVQQRTYADGRARQEGLDLTFSAPKGASILWGLNPTVRGKEVRPILEKAHENAVKAALDYIQRNAAFTRRGKDGLRAEPCDMVFALFQHGTSRDQEMALHTHALTPNVAFRADGTSGTLRTRDLFIHKMAAGAVYRSHFMNEVHREGLTAHPWKSNTLELNGIPENVRDYFSSRSKTIRQFMAERGWSGPIAAAKAALATRSVKGHVALNELTPKWRDEARELDFSLEQAAALFGQPIRLDPIAERRSVEAATKLALNTLANKHGVFEEVDVIRFVAEKVQTQGVDARIIEETVQSLLSSEPNVIHLGPSKGYDQYTSRQVKDLESELFAIAERSKSLTGHVVDQAHIDKVLRSRPTLTDEQKAALLHITQKPGTIQCVSGLPGTGKTFLMDAAREAWERQGLTVLGCSVAARAARQLQDDAKIPSASTAKVIYDLERSKLGIVVVATVRFSRDVFWRFRRQPIRQLTSDIKRLIGKVVKPADITPYRFVLNKNTVLVMDEASMVGTRQMTLLARAAERAGAKIVAIGGIEQLPPVDDRGPFKSMCEVLGAARLQVITRQHEPWMMDAVRMFSEGDARGALSQYALAGRLHVAKKQAEAVNQLLDWWKRERTEDLRETMIVSGTRENAQILNGLAQAARLTSREISRDSFAIGDTRFHVGDRVMCVANDRRLGLYNGDFATIEKMHRPVLANRWNTTFTLLLDREERGWFGSHPVRVTLTLAQYRDLELGYAATTHKLQGATFENVYVWGDSMADKEITTVQASRARAMTRIFCTDESVGEDISALAKQMSVSHKKDLVHDMVKERNLSLSLGGH